MSLTPTVSSTQTATVIGTEYALLDTGTAGTYGGDIDITNLVVGERVQIRVYAKTASGGSYVKKYDRTFSGGASELLKQLSPVLGFYGVKTTLTQLNGTGRVFPFVLGRVDG